MRSTRTSEPTPSGKKRILAFSHCCYCQLPSGRGRTNQSMFVFNKVCATAHTATKEWGISVASNGMSPPGHWTRSRQTRTVLIRQFLRVGHGDEVFCAFCHRTHVLPSLAADITGPGSSDMSLVTVTSSGLPYSSPFQRESEDEKHSTSCDPFVSLPTSATSAAPSPPSTSCSPSPASPSLGVRQTVATEAGPEGARESDPSLESALFVWTSGRSGISPSSDDPPVHHVLPFRSHAVCIGGTGRFFRQPVPEHRYSALSARDARARDDGLARWHYRHDSHGQSPHPVPLNLGTQA